MDDRVFTGDTLLIRGTGRTDFQNGSPRAQYESIFNRLLKLPDETMVFPAHDYKGDTVSTIGEEKRHNPRLQVRSVDEYIELMNNLTLPNPKLMEVVIPANIHVGLRHADLAKQFYEFVSTPAALEAASQKFYRIPARTDIPLDSLPQWVRDAKTKIKPMPLDRALLAKHLDEWMRYWDSNIRNRSKKS